MIVIVEVLYNILYCLFSQELINLNVGYNFNEQTLNKINEILNAIDYIQHGSPNVNEIIKIIQYYE